MDGDRGDLVYHSGDYFARADSTSRINLATLTLRQPFLERFEVEVGARFADKKFYVDAFKSFQDLSQASKVLSTETTGGLATRLIWRGATNLLVAGAEYEKVHLRVNESLMAVDTLRRDADRWGFYLNDTISLGSVAVSPGLRYDLVGNGSEQFSPSLGVTWQLSENNLLRAYTARGYSLPPLLRNLSTEKVWTTQFGLESSSLANLWVKGTLFRNDTWDIFTYAQTIERQIKQGGELELRTTPWHGASFSGGYTYIDARRRSDRATVEDVPSQTVQLGLRYDDLKYLQTLLTGRYIWWNGAANHLGRYSTMVWDLHLTATPFGRGADSPEVFFSIRNLFNGAQYLDEAYRNAGRWAELGVRVRF
jgi:vitamin B12 transporter